MDPAGVWDTFRNLYSVLVVLVFAIANHNTTLSGQIYPGSQSGQRILMDTQSGLIDNLTTAEIQLVGPILPILKAETSHDRDFILLEQENESLSPYQYQSDIPIKDGLPLRLARLADFENVPSTTSESNGVKDVLSRINSWDLSRSG